MGIIYATGFQHGVPLDKIDGVTKSNDNCAIVEVQDAKFGNRCLMVSGVADSAGYVKFSLTQSYLSLWISTWHKTPSGGGAFAVLSAVGDDTVRVAAYYDETNYKYVLYVGNTQVGVGQQTVLPQTWHYIELYYDQGSAILYVDGALEVAWHGTIYPANVVALYSSPDWGHTRPYFNSLIVSTNRVGDVRFASYAPSANVLADFTPVGEPTNYQCVNELPFSVADYVYAATTTSAEDQYETDGPGIISNADQVLGVVLHVYANRSAADGSTPLAMRIGDGYQTETVRTVNIIDTNEKLYSAVAETRPGGSSWNAQSIENLRIGFAI